MNEFADLVPLIAAQLHIAPSTLLLIMIVVVKGANIAARVIPEDAVGFAGYVRRTAAIVGLYFPSRITGTTTVTDVAKAALTTPPIPAKVEASKDDAS